MFPGTGSSARAIEWLSGALACLGFAALGLAAIRLRARAPRRGREPGAPAVEERSTHLGLLVEEAKDYAIYQTDARNRVVTWNPGAERLLGWRCADVLGQDAAIFYPEDQARAGKPLRDLERSRAGGTFREEAWRVRKDGSRFMADVAITAIPDGPGPPSGFLRVTHDITERQEAEARLKAVTRDLTAQMERRTAELQESEARIQGFIRHAPAAIAVKGPDGRLLLVNRRAEALIGMCQAVTPDGTGERIFTAEQMTGGREEDERVLNRREELQAEEEVLFPDGTRRDYLIQKFPLVDGLGRCWGLGIIATNITDRKDAEQARLQGRKLEALGLLAGGMAHDFNNILGAMLGNVELARLELGPLDHLATLEALVSRASGLVGQLVAYAGMGKEEVKQLDLNAQVEEMTRILRASLPRKVVLVWSPDPGLPPTEGDVGQIRQVILNLIANAAEAVTPMGGLVTLRTRCETLTQGDLDRRFKGQSLAPGPHVALEVSDNGPGMAADVLERIFDPFFTTKFSGRGLGLSAVQGILRGHRGGIKVLSEEGKGTTFTFLLPACEGSLAPEAPDPGTAEPALPLAGAVLVVDDEDAVRSVAVRALQRLGLETLEARDGLEALAVHEAHWDRIRLILMDLTMPRMGGEEAYRELRRAGALAPIVLSSGFGPEEALQRFRGMALAGFLQKPYRLQDLLATVGRALEGMDAAPGLRGEPPRELVAWIPEFNTGHLLMDTQHKGLIRAFNHLVTSTEFLDGKRGDPGKALALLIEAMIAHGKAEEALLDEEGYPKAREHKAAHLRLLNQFQDLAFQVRRGEEALTPAAFNFLEDALLDHIQLEDLDWARFRNDRLTRP